MFVGLQIHRSGFAPSNRSLARTDAASSSSLELKIKKSIPLQKKADRSITFGITDRRSEIYLTSPVDDALWNQTGYESVSCLLGLLYPRTGGMHWLPLIIISSTELAIKLRR